MKHLVILLAIFLTSSVHAEEVIQEEGVVASSLPIVCENNEKLIKNLKEEYGEDLLFLGQNIVGPEDEGNVFTTVWINEKTMTWSLVITNKKENQSCFVGGGKLFSVFSKVIFRDSI